MKLNRYDCDNSCFMCRLCQAEWIPAIAAQRKLYDYKKGENIFVEGDRVQGMFFIYSGSVKVHKKWGADKELIVRIASKGDIIGHRGLGADDLYPVSGTALEAVTACFIDMAFFTATLKVNPELLYQLMLFFATELKVSERKMRNLTHMPVKGRIALALLNLQEKFGEDVFGAINIQLPRQDLASLAGTTYETVFRTLVEMGEEQMVKVKGKQVWILNKDKLRTFTEFQN